MSVIGAPRLAPHPRTTAVPCPPQSRRRLHSRSPAPTTGGTTTTSVAPTQREPELLGQTVAVIGGSAGIGLETARRARAEDTDVIVTGRNPERLEHVARELDAKSTAAFDANDPAALAGFFEALPAPLDHVMLTAGGAHYGRMLEMSHGEARAAMSEHMLLAPEVARNTAGKVRPGGTLLLIGGTGGRRIGLGLGTAAALTAAMPAREPRFGARTGPGQPHRPQLRRHATVRIDPRRRARGQARGAADEAADRPRRRA